MRIVKYNNNNVFPSSMNEFFNDDFRMNLINRNHSIPSVNSVENNESFEIDLAVPGMKKDDFTIELNDKVFFEFKTKEALIIENLNDPFALKEEFVQLATIDVPWISAEVFDSLERSISKKDEVIIPTDGKILHPLLSLVRPNLLIESLRNWNETPLHEMFLKIPHSLLIVEPNLIKNINYSKDL